MLVAHMDEVGLIVRRILPNGFLKVERLGGMGVQALPGSPLTLWSDGGALPAHVGLLPQHLASTQSPELNTLFIDIGARGRDEAQQMGVQVGDGLTWAGALETIGQGRVRSKALDDRLGCLALLALAQQVGRQQTLCDLYLAFVVQEETMLMGGAPVVNAIRPEIVIGIDGTLAFDTPDLEGEQCDLRLGGGPALKWMDALRGKSVAYVPSRRLAQIARSQARALGIPLQSEIVTGLSTAVSPLPYLQEGSETLALSIPIRYHHSPVETADLQDAEQLVWLCAALIESGFESTTAK
jgi:putative aminopeptidase FrvX